MIDWEQIKQDAIGIVASPSSESEAQCILHEGKEREITNETLVLIDNRNGNKVLAICREGHGNNEALRTGYYTPGVAYARSGHAPSTAKEFFGFRLVVIGDVTDGEVKQNRIIIAPASPVYKLNDKINPMELLNRSRYTIGYYATGHKNWEVPVLSEYIPHHIGVFGVTGSGKSYLCRHQIIPLLRKARYDVLIFDWKGSDYAPHYAENVINMGDVKLDEQSVFSYLSEKLNGFGGGKTGERLVSYLEEVISAGDWRGSDHEETKKRLLDSLKQMIHEDNKDKDGNLSRWGRIYTLKAERTIQGLPSEELKPVMGNLTPEEIIKRLREEHIIVVDQSYGAKEQKLSIFLSLARYLKKLMEAKEKLNIAIVIDEAPQYCPWQPRGIEEETTKMLIGLAALGRSYDLSLILVAQGIAGEIGINAAVRRNLNTLFIGRIHPLDAQEAEKFFAASWVKADSLLRLPEGQFYMIGKMNPSTLPLLITFEIPEEEEKIGAGR